MKMGPLDSFDDTIVCMNDRIPMEGTESVTFLDVGVVQRNQKMMFFFNGQGVLLVNFK